MAKILHFDCLSGVSGDMTLAALIDLGAPEELLHDALDSLGLEGRLKVERIRKAGFAAVAINVETTPTQKHRHLKHVREIIDRGKLTQGARDLAHRMFLNLAEAEAASHGISLEKVHFHEVGAVDSIFDFVGVAVALDHLGVETATSRPVPTGTGTVRCEHGVMPVPAPAVAHLLTGIPLAESDVETELTTPTGAAILKTIVKKFGPPPAMTIEKIGVGAGTRDLPTQPNILRLLLGRTTTIAAVDPSWETDQIWQLETNLDDAAAEILGYCMEQLLQAGALDVFATPIQMKKQRPGTLLTILCSGENLAKLERIVFRETGTLGLRKTLRQRSKQARAAAEVQTPWGTAKGKLGWADGQWVFAPEYEDCARLARAHDVPLRTVYQAAASAFTLLEPPAPPKK